MSKRILVVEDEPSIADNITYALSTEGFDPVCCGTGEEALRALRADDIALAILDVGLPDMSGFDLLKEIRKVSALPVIIVTARADEVDRIVGLEIGADDYVVKPFSPRELTARVKAVLRRSGEKKSETPLNHVHGPFEIDEVRYVIRYHDQALDLARYEFRLLQALLMQPGRVFTREQLMNAVWEEPEMSLERTVDTHIKNIRQKLKQIDPDQDPIITHRGIGYSLKEKL